MPEEQEATETAVAPAKSAKRAKKFAQPTEAAQEAAQPKKRAAKKAATAEVPVRRKPTNALALAKQAEKLGSQFFAAKEKAKKAERKEKLKEAETNVRWAQGEVNRLSKELGKAEKLLDGYNKKLEVLTPDNDK